MTNKNGDMPAMPITYDHAIEARMRGLTKREMFCLHMGVAETGDMELDAIISKGNQQKVAANVMAAFINAAALNGMPTEHYDAEPIAKASVFASDLLLAELERTK